MYATTLVASNGVSVEEARTTVTVVDRPIVALQALNSGATLLGRGQFSRQRSRTVPTSPTFGILEMALRPAVRRPATPMPLRYRPGSVTALNGAGPTNAQTSWCVTNQRRLRRLAGLVGSVRSARVHPGWQQILSDPDGHLPLAYRWVQSRGPSVSLSGAGGSVDHHLHSAAGPGCAGIQPGRDRQPGVGWQAWTQSAITVTDVAITGSGCDPQRHGCAGTAHSFHRHSGLRAAMSLTSGISATARATASGPTAVYSYSAAGGYTATVTATNQSSVVDSQHSRRLSTDLLWLGQGVDQTVGCQMRW
jgi:hypothetical protein